MKKWIVSLVALMAICLFGCSNIESSETLDNSYSETSSVSTIESSVSSSSKSTTSVGSTGGLISTNNYFDSQEFFVDYLNNCLWGNKLEINRKTIIYPHSCGKIGISGGYYLYEEAWIGRYSMSTSGTFKNVNYSYYFNFVEEFDKNNFEMTFKGFSQVFQCNIIEYSYIVDDEKIIRIVFNMDEVNEELLNEFIDDLCAIEIDRKFI